MKKIKKSIAVFLAVLTFFSVCSTATGVFAAEYVEEKERAEYFDRNLSEYLKDIIDTDNAVGIKEKTDNENALTLRAEKAETDAAVQSRAFAVMQAAENTNENDIGNEENNDINHERLTLELENGENRAYIFSEPISYTDEDGKLEYKETNIVETDDESVVSQGYAFTNGNNDYKIYFSADPEKGVMLKSAKGSSVKMRPVTASSSSGSVMRAETDTAAVDAFAYSGAFGFGTLLRYTPQLNGCKEEIILDRYTGTNEFSFLMETGGSEARINALGQIEIYNPETFEVLDKFNAPYAYDALNEIDISSCHYSECEYVLTKQADGVYLIKTVVPPEFLTGEATVYPVTVDPTTSNLSQYRDAPIYSKKSTTSFHSNEINCFGKTSEYGYGRVLTYFDMPEDIKDYATINSAYIWMREVTGRTHNMYVKPFIVKDKWYNAVTWATQPTYGEKTCNSKLINSASEDGKGNYWYKFDIKKAVKEWTTGTANRGLIFICKCDLEQDSHYYWYGFASKEHSTSSYRPYAVINYKNDATAPTISETAYTPKTWTNGNVTVTVKASDSDSGLATKAYSFDSGKTWQSSNKYTVSKNQTLQIWVKDKAGNIKKTSLKIAIIDKTAPEIKDPVVLTPSGWTNGSVKLTVTANDVVTNSSIKDASGLASAAYSFDDGKTWQANNYKSFAVNGTVKIKVRDAVGNTAAKSVVINKIDKTAPTVTIGSSVNGDNAVITVNASDAGSGLSSAAYSFDGGKTWSGSKVKSDAKARDRYDIWVRDNVNNIYKKNGYIPSAYISASTTEYTNQNVTLTIVATDAKEYSFDNGATWSASPSKAFSANCTVKAKVRTAENKIISIPDYLIENIDKEIPGAPTLAEDNGFVTVTENPVKSEGGSEEHLEYSIGADNDWKVYDAEPIEIINSGDIAVFARAVDEATNASEAVSLTVKNRVGEYVASYSDLELSDSVFPISFGRSYSSSRGWSFDFNADVSLSAVKTNGAVTKYTFSDIYGESFDFALNDGKFVNEDIGELSVGESAYSVSHDGLTYRFADNGADSFTLNSIEHESTVVTFAKSGGRLTSITVKNSLNNSESRSVSYSWEQDGESEYRLVGFTDVGGQLHTYGYTGGLLTSNDGETISYSGEKVSRVGQKDGAFVNYYYSEVKADEADPDSETVDYKVVSLDSRGVVDESLYSEGFTATGGIGGYSDSARLYADEELAGGAVSAGFIIVRDAEAPSDGDSEEQTNSAFDKDSDGNYVFYKYETQDSERLLAAAYVLKEKVADESTADYDTVAPLAYRVESYTYEGDNLSQTLVRTADENGALADAEKVEYVYTDGKLTGTSQSVCSGGVWSVVYVETVAYSGESVPTGGRKVTQTAVNGETTTETVAEYDFWGNKIGSEVTTTVGENATSEKYCYRYDGFDRVTEIYIPAEGQDENDETVAAYVYDAMGNLVSAVSDGKTTSYSYSAEKGNLVSRTNPDGSVAAYGYDENGNLTSHSFNGYGFTYNTLGSILTAKVGEQKLAEYKYSSDLKQNVTKMTFGNGQSVNYEYNANGDVTAVKVGSDVKFSYEYLQQKDENDEVQKEWTELTDNINNLKKIIEEDKTTIETIEGKFLYSVENMYRSVNNASSFDGTEITIGKDVYCLVKEKDEDIFITNGSTEFTKKFTYSGDDISRTETAGHITTYEYDEKNRVSSYKNILKELTQVYSYEYDKNDNIVKETVLSESNFDCGAENVDTNIINHVYDSNGQLIATETSSVKYEYAYDNRGNILTKKEYDIDVDDNGEKVYTLISDKSTNYMYDDVWKDELISYDDQSITYDNVGNPKNYLGHTLRWSCGKQLISFDDVTYKYDENGIRTSKESNNVTTKFYLDGTKIVEQCDGNKTIHFFYDSKGEILGFKYNGETYFYVKNLQCDIIGIIDIEGNVVVKYEYDPWGKVVSISGNNIQLGELNPFRYKAYYYDSETDLYYIKSRYYDANTGRFINVDDINYIGVTKTTISYNPFSYCENSPINKCDFDGKYSVGLKGWGYYTYLVSMAFANGWNILGWIAIGVTVSIIIGYSIYYYKEHTTTKNGKKRNKHEEGEARRKRDQGGEKKKQKPGWKSRR